MLYRNYSFCLIAVFFWKSERWFPFFISCPMSVKNKYSPVLEREVWVTRDQRPDPAVLIQRKIFPYCIGRWIIWSHFCHTNTCRNTEILKLCPEHWTADSANKQRIIICSITLRAQHPITLELAGEGRCSVLIFLNTFFHSFIILLNLGRSPWDSKYCLPTSTHFKSLNLIMDKRMYVPQVMPQKKKKDKTPVNHNVLEIFQTYSVWAKYLVWKITVQMVKNC